MSTLKKIIEGGGKLTPMMEQYYQIKKNYPHTLLLFRMGDFYELFFEDALTAVKILNIALTHRGKVCGEPIPMAGIPHHALGSYIDRLTGYGAKVAICEQTESPKESQGIVSRAVVRIVSPGMPFDPVKLGSEHQFILCAYESGGYFYLVACDYTTGKFVGHQFDNYNSFLSRFLSYDPREFICYIGQWKEYKEMNELPHSVLITRLAKEYFDFKFNRIYIEKLSPGIFFDKAVEHVPAIFSPMGALSFYICSTQSRERFVHIRPFCLENETDRMWISPDTFMGLGIIPAKKEDYKESLLGFLDKTKTSMGSRFLRSFLSSPITDKDLLNKRHDMVEVLLQETSLLEEIRNHLKDIFDLERILSKMPSRSINPGDLINLARSVKTGLSVISKLDKLPKGLFDEPDEDDKHLLNRCASSILETISDVSGASVQKGNLIRKGIDEERDRLAGIGRNIKEGLVNLESRYRKETGIANLKIKYNNVAGYFIEVSKSHVSKIPSSFTRRQTLVNSERYHTEELTSFENDSLAAKERLTALERNLFTKIVNETEQKASSIMKLSQLMASIDVFQSIAWTALVEDFVRPEIVDKKLLNVSGGWHPLMKVQLKDGFTSHNLSLDEDNFFALITGPNMAGKTTVMREVAIIQLLAQIGSFVPAVKASLGVCGHLFSRLGARDDILQGRSTFMVEMSETAEILRHANERSLIVLDEIGRGTSTYDGISIAWALMEHFVLNVKSLSLFATHYHELTALAEKLPGAGNFTMETVLEGEDVHFLYNFIKGGAAQSYGVYVAKLAGLPPKILERAREILSLLEKDRNRISKEPSLTPSQNSLSLLHESVEKLEDLQQIVKPAKDRHFSQTELSP